MANAVVTSTTKSVKVVFNDSEPYVGYNHAWFSRAHILEVKCKDSYSEIVMTSGTNWLVSTDGNSNTLPVDSVDGVTPSNEHHLCDLIAGLIDY